MISQFRATFESSEFHLFLFFEGLDWCVSEGVERGLNVELESKVFKDSCECSLLIFRLA